MRIYARGTKAVPVVCGNPKRGKAQEMKMTGFKFCDNMEHDNKHNK